MKILILGSQGMFGSDLSRVFFDFNPICWGQNDLDIADEKTVYKKIDDLKPDIIISAAAYTDVDGCETNQELAMKVNGEAVGYLARAAQSTGATLVHYSTDYVFDGKNPHGYAEDDLPGEPLNVYGKSKLLGEKLFMEHETHNIEQKLNYYLIRTSWLFGKDGKNFVDTMLKLANGKDEIKVVNDQYGKPTYALDLARKTRELIEEKYPAGIYHITNEGETTWYDFACEIFRQAKELGIIARVPKVIPCSSDDYPLPAKRPNYSILVNTKLPPMRPWQNSLTEYLNSITIELAI